MQKRSRPEGNGVGYSLGNQNRAQRSIATGQSFGGDQNVRRDIPMVDREMPPDASHTSHYFIGDQENAVPAADLSHTLQISGRWHHSTKCCPADRFDDEGGDFALGRLDRLFQFCGVLLTAITATVGAIKGTAIAIRKRDMREFPYHGQIHFTPPLVS